MVGIRRREFISFLAGAAGAWPLAARAQQPAMPVIGFLYFSSAEPLLAGFRQGLNEAGYVEHRNVVIEYRFANNRPDRLVDLAAELVHRQVAVIAATPTNAALAAIAATASIPIVFGVGIDPVTAGLVKSLNRPGGNATGRYYFSAALAAKRLGLLRELVPSARRIAMLLNPNTPAVGVESTKTEAQAAATALGLELEFFHAANNLDIDAAFADFAKEGVDALLVSPSQFFISRRVQLVTLAIRDRLPVIFPSREFAEAGGLMTYGVDVADEYRQMGVYAGRILKGAKPADLPVEQSTKFEFIINLQTARLLGFEVPPGLSARADEIIE
jgi:putative ABC transport system substrate-binding protein